MGQKAEGKVYTLMILNGSVAIYMVKTTGAAHT